MANLFTELLNMADVLLFLLAVIVVPILYVIDKNRTARQRVLYGDGRKLYEAGKYSECLDKFLSVVKIDSSGEYGVQARLHLGDACLELGRGDETLKHMELLLKKHKDDATRRAALLLKGMALLLMGDKMNAKKLLDEVAQKYPSTVESKRALQIITNAKLS